MLKQSLYNIYVKNEKNQYVVYNTLYGGMIELSSKEFENIQNKLFTSFSEDELQLLIQNGFLVDSKLDEYFKYNSLRKKILECTTEDQVKNYTIAVTTMCNARCFYCYEKGIRHKHMTLETAQQVLSFIERNAREDEKINITWFGGEPLLRKEIISYISEGLQRKNISYESIIVTNGILFSNEMIKNDISKWKVNKVQITIDGIGEKYSRIKNYIEDYENPFSKVISNIDQLISNNICVDIRINIGKNNYIDMLEVVKYLSEKYPLSKNLYVYPAFISLDNNIDDFSERDKIEIITKFVNQLPFFSRIWCKEKLYGFPDISACMREEKESIFIDSDGSISRCEQLAGKKKLAHVKQKCKVEDICCDYCYDEKCSKCAFFPKCLGGCMEQRLQNGTYCAMDKYIILALLKEFV